MDDKQRGGSRLNSGRKKANDIKVPITIYVSAKDIWLFGNKDNLRGELLDYIKERQPAPESQLLILGANHKIDQNHFEKYATPVIELKIAPTPILSPFADFEDRILKTTMPSELDAINREIRASLMTVKEKQNLETTAKDHSKDFYTD